jgi:hypothetical protein
VFISVGINSGLIDVRKQPASDVVQVTSIRLVFVVNFVDQNLVFRDAFVPRNNAIDEPDGDQRQTDPLEREEEALPVRPDPAHQQEIASVDTSRCYLFQSSQ